MNMSKVAGNKLQVMADELFLYREKILNAFSSACLNYLEAGKYLIIVRQKKLWRLDGHHVKRFEQWVTMELGISKSTAFNAINVYEKYGDIIESSPEYQRIDFSHFVALLPYVSDKSTVGEKEKLLDLAKGQTVQGLKDNLRELAGKKPSDSDCEHKDTTPVQICNECGKWLR
jgi:hypothetical protein